MYKIKPASNVSSHLTHRLDPSITPQVISRLLGFEPNIADDPDKVTHSWAFTVGGAECAIWDYKGSRWSAYDPHGRLEMVFPPNKITRA